MITENLSTLKIHKMTQDQYDREYASGNVVANEFYLTPDEDKYVIPINISSDSNGNQLVYTFDESFTFDIDEMMAAIGRNAYMVCRLYLNDGQEGMWHNYYFNTCDGRREFVFTNIINDVLCAITISGSGAITHTTLDLTTATELDSVTSAWSSSMLDLQQQISDLEYRMDGLTSAEGVSF